MSQRTTRARVLGKLLESLGTAETGSRELDIVIAYILGDASSEAGRMIQLLVGEGYSWDIVSELLDEDLAPYTSSLDAAVPGERIVLSLYSPRRRRWAAVQGSPSLAEPPGAEALSWAATECLARRRAALQALYGQHAHVPADEATATRQHSSARARAPGPAAPPAATSPRAPAAEGSESSREEWKILF